MLILKNNSINRFGTPNFLDETLELEKLRSPKDSKQIQVYNHRPPLNRQRGKNKRIKL
jgi:hypothetical protein